MLVEDSWGHVFGAFIGNPIQNSSNYYGSAESFVFSLSPIAKKYKWTGANNYFVISDHNHFCVGGGGDGFAFQLDDELDTGVSNRSATFDNEQLASSEFFKTLNVELWFLDWKFDI